MLSDVAIKVDDLSKAYKTYTRPADRLKQALFARLRGKLASPLEKFGVIWPEPRYYTESWALHSLSFDVLRGETMAIIGRNGSGKSTLLSLICGTTNSTTGEVTKSGRVGALLELGSGFNPEFTGRENIYLNASILGFTSAQTAARFDDIVSFADIGDYIERPVKTYSSGMTMRLAFSVMAHMDCDILIVDEALAVGDAHFQQKCLRWLRNFQKKGTVLFCSHDTSAVLSLCTRAVWLDAGEVQMIGAAKEVCEAYNAFIHQLATGQISTAPREPGKVIASPRSEPTSPANSDRTDVRASPVAAVSPAMPEPPSAVPWVFDTIATSNSFGTGFATIISGRLHLAGGIEQSLLEGGEAVQLAIKVRANQPLDAIIVGFIVKDRLGQPIFGGNTLEWLGNTFHMEGDDVATVAFNFDLPRLAAGRYAITLAIATGDLVEHVQHHWLHDALMFDVRSTLAGVIFGIPPSQSEVSIKFHSPAAQV